jgi:hypothetical protein
MAKSVEVDSKRAMRFTVKAVREYDRGVTNGREWVKFLVITQEGEIIGTFFPEWKMFVGPTVTVPIKETMVKDKLYKSVERPPANAQQSAIARTTRMSPPPAAPKSVAQAPLLAGETQEMQASIARIEAGLEQLLKRVDAVAALQGDTAEGVRGITVLLQHRLPVGPEDGADEAEEPDREDPGLLEPPEPDDAPREEPDHA